MERTLASINRDREEVLARWEGAGGVGGEGAGWVLGAVEIEDDFANLALVPIHLALVPIHLALIPIHLALVPIHLNRQIRVEITSGAVGRLPRRLIAKDDEKL